MSRTGRVERTTSESTVLVEVDLDTGEIKDDPLGAQPRTRTEKGPRE